MLSYQFQIYIWALWPLVIGILITLHSNSIETPCSASFFLELCYTPWIVGFNIFHFPRICNIRISWTFKKFYMYVWFWLWHFNLLLLLLIFVFTIQNFVYCRKKILNFLCLQNISFKNKSIWWNFIMDSMWIFFNLVFQIICGT